MRSIHGASNSSIIFCFWVIFHCKYTTYIYTLSFFFKLAANYFTILWFLTYIHMNQSWMCMCSPSWTSLPPTPHYLNSVTCWWGCLCFCKQWCYETRVHGGFLDIYPGLHCRSYGSSIFTLSKRVQLSVLSVAPIYTPPSNFGGSLITQLVKIHLQCRRPWFDSWVRKIPWRRERLPIPVFWPEEFQEGLEGVRHNWMTFTFNSVWGFAFLNILHITFTYHSFS